MTITELAAHNQADRLRVLDAAIAEEYRGIEGVRGDGTPYALGRGPSSMARHQANLERLKAERAVLLARMGGAR